MVAVPSFVAFLIYNYDYGQSFSKTFINKNELVYFNVDRLSWIFLFVLALVALSANIYALKVNNPIELASQFIYVGGAFGVLLAGDWLTLIFFWELMAVSSVFLVWSRNDEKSKKAGFRYLLVHFMGGNLLLAGIFLKVSQGEYLIASLTNNMDIAAILIFLGVAVNAAIYPLHAWVPDAYPQGTITGSVFMSFLTTKVAVYTLVRVFPGLEILIWLGCIMALVAVA
jgi:multicomponent Na+:H+ antiporter subunit D